MPLVTQLIGCRVDAYISRFCVTRDNVDSDGGERGRESEYPSYGTLCS